MPISSSKMPRTKFSLNSNHSSACSEAPRPAVALKAMSRNSNNDATPAGQFQGSSGTAAKKVLSRSVSSASVDVGKDHKRASYLSRPSLLQDKLTTAKISTGDHYHHMPGNDILSPRRRENSNSCGLAISDPPKCIETSISEELMEEGSDYSVVEVPDSEISGNFPSANFGETLPPVVGEKLVRKPNFSYKGLPKSTDISTFVDVKDFDRFQPDLHSYVQASQEEDFRENCLQASEMRELEVVVSTSKEDEEVESEYCINGNSKVEQVLTRSSMYESSQTSEAAKEAGMNSSSETPQVSSLKASIPRVSSGTLSTSMSAYSSCTPPTSLGQGCGCSGSFQDNLYTISALSEDTPKAFSVRAQQVQKETSKGFKRLLKFGRKGRPSEQTYEEWSGRDDSSSPFPNTETSKEIDVEDNESMNAGLRSFFSFSSFLGRSTDFKSRP